MLADPAFMKQMLMADGARGGAYGQAMTIYDQIQSQSEQAGSGVLQRLALAVSLQHAQPMNQRNAVAATDAPATIDPVKRYFSYETAYLAGELDPAFKNFDAWELRMVIDGQEPDAISAWGREMLRTYRPDHISNPNYKWRYVAEVRTDVPYRFGYEKEDRANLQLYQNILLSGGVCGRRAFFGRFILRAFGIPTTARPQPGHATLVHWTPDGWVICFGAGWGHGWTKTRYRDDRDFLAVTQARETGKSYMMVKRAQWIGDLFAEPRVFGLHAAEIPDFWYNASLHLQRAINDATKAKTLAAVGEELGEANSSKVKYDEIKTTVKRSHRKITVSKNGVITVPASACSEPEQSTGKILFMPSNLGGLQLHYNRVGKPENFEYTVKAPTTGTYSLLARVATPAENQHLALTVNGGQPAIDLPVPLTVGLWGITKPVMVKLEKGKNTLSFSRSGESVRGLTIKDFTLSPVKQ